LGYIRWSWKSCYFLHLHDFDRAQCWWL